MNKPALYFCIICLAVISCNNRRDLEPLFSRNDSLIACNAASADLNRAVYLKFDKQKAIDSANFMAYWQRAQTTKKLTSELVAYIEMLKAEIISRESGLTVEEARITDLKKIHKLRKYEESTRYLIGAVPDGSEGEAHKLRMKIDAFRETVTGLVDSADGSRINQEIGLDTRGPYYDGNEKLQTWEQHHFYQVMLIADIVVLNQLINELINGEGKVLNLLYGEAGIRE